MLETIPEAAVWAIFGLPLLSLFIIVVVLPHSMAKFAGYIAAVAIGVSFLLSLWALDSSLQNDGERIAYSAQNLLSVLDGRPIVENVINKEIYPHR